MAKNNRTGMLPWLGWALAVVLLDQASKLVIIGSLRLHDSVTISAFFNLVRWHNTGAAFSFLAQASGWQHWLFTGLGLAAALLIVFLLRSHAGQRLFSFALASILGGALGNVIDRLLYGYVVDFLDFHWRSWHFPAFNIADSAISLGAACLILDELRRVRRAR